MVFFFSFYPVHFAIVEVDSFTFYFSGDCGAAVL